MSYTKIFFFLILSYKLEGQQNESLFFKYCNNIEYSILTKSKLHLLGEYHHVDNNDNLQIGYLKYLHENNVYPKYIMVERGPATAYIYNKYYELGEEYLLDLLFAYKSTKDFYRQVYEYRTSLKISQKFEIIGVDYEDSRENAHFAIRDILLTNLKKTDKILFDKVNNYNDFISTDDAFIDLLVSFKIKKNSNWDKKNIKDDLSNVSEFLKSSQDSLRLKKILGADFSLFKKILAAYEAPLNDKKIYSNKKNLLRDKYMAKNIYEKFLLDTNSVIIGQLGMAHIPKTYQKNWSVDNIHSMAKFLNSDSTFRFMNNKVCSNAIIYKSFPVKKYRYLKLEKNDFNVFSKMTDCKIYFVKYKDSTVINNLIYLDNNN